MSALFRSRIGLAIAAAVVMVGATLGAALAVAHFSSGRRAVPAAVVPGVLQTPQPGGCVNKQQAEQVWTDVSARLDALALHPDLGAVDGVAQGTAASQLRQYLQQQLIDAHLTEREKSHLDDLVIVRAACGSQPLTLRVTETLVQDDYLRADGSVDHQDAGVGQTAHLLESFVRSGDTWKVTTIASLDQSPGPGSTV